MYGNSPLVERINNRRFAEIVDFELLSDHYGLRSAFDTNCVFGE